MRPKQPHVPEVPEVPGAGGMPQAFTPPSNLLQRLQGFDGGFTYDPAQKWGPQVAAAMHARNAARHPGAAGGPAGNMHGQAGMHGQGNPFAPTAVAPQMPQVPPVPRVQPPVGLGSLPQPWLTQGPPRPAHPQNPFGF